MKTLYLARYTRSKFQNPFMLKKFYYQPTGKWYRCGNDRIQTLLFLWLYSLGNYRLYSKLFYIEDPQKGLMNMPVRDLSHILNNIYKTGGCEHNNCYAMALDGLYLRFLFEKLLPCHRDIKDNESKIRNIIYQLYPNISKELSKKYPDIKIFL